MNTNKKMIINIDLNRNKKDFYKILFYYFYTELY